MRWVNDKPFSGAGDADSSKVDFDFVKNIPINIHKYTHTHTYAGTFAWHPLLVAVTMTAATAIFQNWIRNFQFSITHYSFATAQLVCSFVCLSVDVCVGSVGDGGGGGWMLVSDAVFHLDQFSVECLACTRKGRKSILSDDDSLCIVVAVVVAVVALLHYRQSNYENLFFHHARTHSYSTFHYHWMETFSRSLSLAPQLAFVI